MRKNKLKAQVKAVLATAIMLLLAHGDALALTDKEYYELMRTSQDFHDSENMLNNEWKLLKSEISNKQAWKVLLLEQRTWLKERDAMATQLMMQGMDKGEAYASINAERVEELRQMHPRQKSAKQSRLRPQPKQSQNREAQKKISDEWETLQPEPSQEQSAPSLSAPRQSAPKPKLDKDGWEILN